MLIFYTNKLIFIRIMGMVREFLISANKIKKNNL
jgi:hypothetical protein